MKKILAVLLSVSMVVGLLTGCGGGDSSTKETKGQTDAPKATQAPAGETQAPDETDAKDDGNTDSGDKVVINYYDWDASASNVVDRFNASQDKIEVVFTQIPDNMDKISKLDVLAMGGGEIDVFPISDGDQFTRMQNGMFAPIDEYIAAEGLNLEESFGEMAKWCEWDGVTYGFPLRASVGGVFYNKNVFDEAGIEYPTGDWTWDEYKDLAAKLTKGEGTDKLYGTFNHIWAGEWSHAATQVTPFYKEDGTSNVGDEMFVKILEDRMALDEAGVQPSYTEIQATQAMPNSFFLGGKCAMVICGAWLIRDMKDTTNFPHDFEIGFTYFPRTTADVASNKNLFMSATMIGIAATSKHPAESYEFIKYLVTEGAKDIAAGGNYPCYKLAFDDDVINAFIEGSGLSFEDGAQLFAEDVALHSTKPLGPGAAAYMDTLGDEQSLYFTGAQDAQTTMDNVANAMNEEIESLK